MTVMVLTGTGDFPPVGALTAMVYLRADVEGVYTRSGESVESYSDPQQHVRKRGWLVGWLVGSNLQINTLEWWQWWQWWWCCWCSRAGAGG
jgi:hypothetical protein